MVYPLNRTLLDADFEQLETREEFACIAHVCGLDLNVCIAVACGVACVGIGVCGIGL
jgi:hypothetical protein